MVAQFSTGILAHFSISIYNNVDAVKFDFEYYYGKEKPEDAKVNGVAYPLYYYRYVAGVN